MVSSPGSARHTQRAITVARGRLTSCARPVAPVEGSRLAIAALPGHAALVTVRTMGLSASPGHLLRVLHRATVPAAEPDRGPQSP